MELQVLCGWKNAGRPGGIARVDGSYGLEYLGGGKRSLREIVWQKAHLGNT